MEEEECQGEGSGSDHQEFQGLTPTPGQGRLQDGVADPGGDGALGAGWDCYQVDSDSARL